MTSLEEDVGALHHSASEEDERGYLQTQCIRMFREYLAFPVRGTVDPAESGKVPARTHGAERHDRRPAEMRIELLWHNVPW